MSKKLRFCMSALLALLMALPVVAPAAAAYPERPITVIIPFGAGSGADRIFRVAQPFMEEAIGQKLVPDYKAGGGGVVGTNYFMTTKPDGYTLLFYNQPHIAIQERFQKTTYKTEKLLPLLGLTWRPDIITVREDSPFTTLEELLAFAKANPGTLTMGNTGSYSSNHLTFAMLSKVADVKMTRVPFESGGKMNAALLGGQIDACVSNMQWLSIHKGKLRVLVSTAEERPMPEIPTFKELGFPSVVNISAVNILYGRQGLPENVVATLSQKLEVLVNNKALKEAFEKEGIDYGVFNTQQMKQLTEVMVRQIEEAREYIVESSK